MTDDALSPVDEDALRRALDEVQRDPQEAEHFARLLKSKSWAEVARTASYHCQRQNLKLKPWESPPQFGDVVTAHGDPKARDKARRLLDRLLASNLSRYEPNPEAALARVERPPAA